MEMPAAGSARAELAGIEMEARRTFTRNELYELVW